MRMRRALLLFFFLVAGIVVGAAVAAGCAEVPALGWLAFSRNIGISPDAPFVLDTSVFRFSFGFSIDISVAQVLCMALAIFLYNVLVDKKK